MELIQGLLDISQDGVLDFLELILDKAIFLLIHLDLFEDKVAFATTSVHEDIGLCTPSELVNTWFYHFVQTCQMLSEQLFLVLVDEKDDIVVVTDDEHHILTQLSQPISLRVLTRER